MIRLETHKIHKKNSYRIFYSFSLLPINYFIIFNKICILYLISPITFIKITTKLYLKNRLKIEYT
jgi:hypothetical protein